MTTNNDDTKCNQKQPEVSIFCNLTEQWKKGELEGEYYIETTNGEIYNVEFQNSISVKKKKLLKVKSFKGYVHKKTVKEVLAPVPSYEELEELKIDNHNLKAWIKHFQPKYKKMEAENQQLKELLKKLHRDAQEIVLYSHDIADIDQEDWFTISRRQADVANNIAKDIYNAIGEKK